MQHLFVLLLFQALALLPSHAEVLSGTANYYSPDTQNYCVVAGGSTNSILGTANSAAISGGSDNAVVGASSACVSGGLGNTVNVAYGTIAGGTSKVLPCLCLGASGCGAVATLLVGHVVALWRIVVNPMW